MNYLRFEDFLISEGYQFKQINGKWNWYRNGKAANNSVLSALHVEYNLIREGKKNNE